MDMDTRIWGATPSTQGTFDAERCCLGDRRIESEANCVDAGSNSEGGLGGNQDHEMQCPVSLPSFFFLLADASRVCIREYYKLGVLFILQSA